MNNVSQQLTDRADLGLYRTKRDYEKSDHTTEDLHHFHYISGTCAFGNFNTKEILTRIVSAVC